MRFLSWISVHGEWSDWKDWSDCSVLCDGGTKSRTRQCDDPVPQHGGRYCKGPAQEIAECNTDACPGKLTASPPQDHQKNSIHPQNPQFNVLSMNYSHCSLVEWLGFLDNMSDAWLERFTLPQPNLPQHSSWKLPRPRQGVWLLYQQRRLFKRRYRF